MHGRRNRGWNDNGWDRGYQQSSWDNGDRGAYSHGYGYDGPYGYYGGPIEEGLGIAGDVVAGAGEVVGGALGAAAAAAGGPYYAQGYGPGPDAYAQGYGPGAGAVSYCESRFRSYDPASGTYLGFDGRRHPCP